MKTFLSISKFILAGVLIWTFGCSTTAYRPDVLAGFHFSSLSNLQANSAITEDYKNYIRSLSPEESRSAGPIRYLENQEGQHAVVIMIGINNEVWQHVLIYDTNNTRIKAFKYVSGDYHS